MEKVTDCFTDYKTTYKSTSINHEYLTVLNFGISKEDRKNHKKFPNSMYDRK